MKNIKIASILLTAVILISSGAVYSQSKKAGDRQLTMANKIVELINSGQFKTITVLGIKFDPKFIIIEQEYMVIKCVNKDQIWYYSLYNFKVLLIEDSTLFIN